jgi:hypothetical protein
LLETQLLRGKYLKNIIIFDLPKNWANALKARKTVTSVDDAQNKSQTYPQATVVRVIYTTRPQREADLCNVSAHYEAESTRIQHPICRSW